MGSTTVRKPRKGTKSKAEDESAEQHKKQQRPNRTLPLPKELIDNIWSFVLSSIDTDSSHQSLTLISRKAANQRRERGQRIRRKQVSWNEHVRSLVNCQYRMPACCRRALDPFPSGPSDRELRMLKRYPEPLDMAILATNRTIRDDVHDYIRRRVTIHFVACEGYYFESSHIHWLRTARHIQVDFWPGFLGVDEAIKTRPVEQRIWITQLNRALRHRTDVLSFKFSGRYVMSLSRILHELNRGKYSHRARAVFGQVLSIIQGLPTVRVKKSVSIRWLEQEILSRESQDEFIKEFWELMEQRNKMD